MGEEWESVAKACLQSRKESSAFDLLTQGVRYMVPAEPSAFQIRMLLAEGPSTFFAHHHAGLLQDRTHATLCQTVH